MSKRKRSDDYPKEPETWETEQHGGGREEEEEGEEDGDPRKNICPPHPMLDRTNRCLRCQRTQIRTRPEDAYELRPFDYIQEGLRIRSTFIEEVRHISSLDVLLQRKLFLVLNLDHTLLHSRLHGLETTLAADPADGLFECGGRRRLLVKLRPYVQRFLKNVATIYDLMIYTKADRGYAREMAELLDPEDEYFHRKVVCGQDCRKVGEKSLDVVVGAHQAFVVIVDDGPEVWSGKNMGNLVCLDKFFFPPFQDPAWNGRAFKPSRLLDLAYILQRIHHRFYKNVERGMRSMGSQLEPSIKAPEVSAVIASVRKKTLPGCRLLFSSLRGQEQVGDDVKRLWVMAVMLGATCSCEVSPEVTHVVCCRAVWDEIVNWATANHKFLVTDRWLEEAYYSWKKPLERRFSVTIAPLMAAVDALELGDRV